jgi:predicted DNA-binding protein YlxM (UPF0122 family)
MKKKRTLNLSSEQWEHYIDLWVLSKRNREILREVMVDDMTYEEVADKNHLTAQSIKRIVAESRDVIKSHIEASP